MYYWRVRSLNSLNFPGAWSPSRSFTITTTRKGAWVDQLEFTAIPNISNVPNAILSGAIDLYASTISDPNIGHSYDVDSSIFNYSESTASIDQLLFNTVSCEDPNKLNPFSYMKIREAMNWAVDREYINGEILMGFGIPQYTVVNANSPDYIRYQGKMDEIVEKYRYDFVHAQSVVTEEMTTMGAILGEDGKWQYHGMPVTLIGLIRTEDSRKKIGDYFADQLEKLGFTVDRQYKLRSAASPIWNTSDWDPCLFNFYTAGWINGGISRDEGGNFAGYNDSMAGWSNGFVNYDPSPEYKEVLAKLFQNNYSTWNVRDTLLNQALDYSMQESWHGLMVSNLFDFAPYRQGLTVTSDAVTNICGNPLWPLTIQKNDSVGGIVKIAQSGILVNPWNPLYGSNWCDDITPQKATESFGTFLDPQTGVALPQRIASAAVTVQTGLPIKKNCRLVNTGNRRHHQCPRRCLGGMGCKHTNIYSSWTGSHCESEIGCNLR